jgi:hypothetical protein
MHAYAYYSNMKGNANGGCGDEYGFKNFKPVPGKFYRVRL